MRPVRTKYTQGSFGENMPYSFVRDSQGVFFAITWKGTLLDRMVFFLTGKITVKTYSQTQPPMIIKTGETI